MLSRFVGQSEAKDVLCRMAHRSFFSLTAPAHHGKNFMVACFSEEFNLSLYRVPDSKVESLREMELKSMSVSCPTVFVLSAPHIPSLSQSFLLKFTESMPERCKLVVCVPTVYQLMPAVRSRVCPIRFGTYTKDELLQFTSDERVLRYADSPGLIMAMSDIDLVAYEARAELVVNSIAAASLPNVLKILSIIKEGHEDLFLLILMKVCGYRMRDNLDIPICSAIVRVIGRHKSALALSSINRRAVFDAMFLDMRDEARACLRKN